MVFILTQKQQIEINNLSFAYQKNKKIINNLSLAIPMKSFSLLIGPTGCGKSTLLKLIDGLYPKFAGHMSGKISLNGLSHAMMFQAAGEQFTMATPREEIIFALENLGLDHNVYEQRLKKAVVFTQISKLLDQKIATLSGGEQQRVALAVLIAMDCDLFLLDEPFASVDPVNRKFLIEQLSKLRDQGKTIIISDHLLTDYENACDHIFQFKKQTIVRLPQQEKQTLLQQAETKQEFHFALPKNEEAVFTLKDAQIMQRQILLKQNELNIPRGKTILITGPNGIGKTSFFKALTKMIPYEGNILFNKQEIRNLRSRKYLLHVAQIFQAADDQFLRITVKDEITLSKKIRNSFFTDERIDQALVKLDLKNHLDQVVYSLSGGQKKKLQILLMLMTKHDALLIDEPLSGLDAVSITQVIDLLKSSQKQLHTTYLIISHQINELAAFCDYHLVFAEQKLHYESEAKS